MNQRSEEHSPLLPIASNTFLGKRYGPTAAIRRIEKQNDPRVRGILLHRLFGQYPNSPFDIPHCAAFLQREACSGDGDLKRFSAALLLFNWPWPQKVKLPIRVVHRSVKLLMTGLGIRRKGPPKATVLDVFFREKQKIMIPIPWKIALKTDWRETERRCLEFQRLLVGNPGARLLMLDTFNEFLIQNFSLTHQALAGPYRKAAGRDPQPDFGAWLWQPDLATVLPKAAIWFKTVHDARKGNELAHAKVKKGSRRGKPTKPIDFQDMERLMLPAHAAWGELIKEWKQLL